MAFDKHSKWAHYLSLAEWWYNTTWHSALQTTPFEALYGYPPPLLALASAPKSQVDSVNDFLRDRQLSLIQLKLNLQKAQDRMKRNADRHRTERSFSVGDWVYLKIQPYRQLTLGGSRNQKLCPKFYGPFEVLQRVGSVAYRLNLPPGTLLHPVFHVSQLKAQLGQNQTLSHTFSIPPSAPPKELVPKFILGRRLLPRQNAAQVQVLIQWQNQSPEDATWEDHDQFAADYLDFIREDTNSFKGGAMRRASGNIEDSLLIVPTDKGSPFEHLNWEGRVQKNLGRYIGLNCSAQKDKVEAVRG